MEKANQPPAAEPSTEHEEHEHVHGEACDHHHHHEQRFVTKIGRNEPCPCGSGKKYKKCCLGKE